AAAMQHLQAGGTWTRWGLFTTKVMKERTYLRDHITVDGQPADTPERLQAICHHLDLGFAIETLERAWSDHGGLPAGSELRIRLAEIKEHVGILDDALAYAQACLEQSYAMAAATPAIPEPHWLNGQAQKWLPAIQASAMEERHRHATEQVSACVHDLKALHDLHDAHPLIGSLIQAVEQRDVHAYSQAHREVLGIEQSRCDHQQRQHIETVLSAAVPGLL